MLETVKKQFSIQWKDWIWVGAFLFGAAVLGMGMHLFIVKIDKTVNTYFALGTVFSGVLTAILGGIMIITQFGIYFHAEISLGCRRDYYLLSVYFFDLAALLGCLAAVILVNIAENALEAVMYPDLSCEIDFLPYLLKWGFPVILLLCVGGIFCGALLLRFGKRAFWVLWTIWMAACIGGPQVLNAMTEAPDSPLGRIGNFFMELGKRIPGNAAAVLIVVLLAVCMVFTWKMIKKQEVAL